MRHRSFSALSQHSHNKRYILRAQHATLQHKINSPTTTYLDMAFPARAVRTMTRWTGLTVTNLSRQADCSQASRTAIHATSPITSRAHSTIPSTAKLSGSMLGLAGVSALSQGYYCLRTQAAHASPAHDPEGVTRPQKTIDDVVLPRPASIEDGRSQGLFRWPTSGSGKEKKPLTEKDESQPPRSAGPIGGPAFWTQPIKDLKKAQVDGEETKYAREVNDIKAKEQQQGPRASDYFVMGA